MMLAAMSSKPFRLFDPPSLPGEEPEQYGRLCRELQAGASTADALLREVALANLWDARRFRRASSARLSEQTDVDLLDHIIGAMSAGEGERSRIERRARNLLERHNRGDAAATRDIETA